MADVLARLMSSPCLPSIRAYVVGFGAVFIVMLLGDLYSRRASNRTERRRRFLTITSAAIILSVAALFFLFAEVCASGEACSKGADVRCDGFAPLLYAFAAGVLPLVSLGVASRELVRRLKLG